MAKPVLSDNCCDPECVFCQEDDGDAAFWDEFYYGGSLCDEEDYQKELFLPVHDEASGQMMEFEGLVLDENLPVTEE